MKRCAAALTFAIATSALSLVAVPAAAAEMPLVKAYNQSGLELFRIFAEQPGNIVFSPYSIGSAMAMALSGARGETQADMLKALRHSLPASEIDAANAKALAALLGEGEAGAKCPDGFKLNAAQCEAKAPKEADAECPGAATRKDDLCVIDADATSAKLRIANALMLVNPQATVDPAYKATIQKNYSAEIFQGANLDVINSWVANKTEGKIEKILDKLNPNDSHVLLNAIYFNAPWAQAFAKNGTRDREFHLTADDKVEVPTMNQQHEFATIKADGYSAIRLPYGSGGLSMIVVRPDEISGLAAVIKSLDADKLGALTAQLAKAPKKMVTLSMPRFKTEFRADLVDPFKSLGMSKVFDPAQSDLSGLTGKPRAEQQSSIDQIVHRAVIDVAEAGTEAAAATAVVVTTRTLKPDDSERFTVDRPFVFLITDDKTGAILFAGRISDPRS
ncbi:MAG: serpin family protein [Pseudorhodoplanes sp.]